MRWDARTEMTLPNFIVAGAPKSGTSSLVGYLRQHPDIYISQQKELFFFDFNYDKGVEWYRSHFIGAEGYKAIGEATVWYMRWKTVPERMASVIPDAKLLFVLRNPIDRAYSNWCHEKRDGRHPLNESFDAFLRRSDRDARTIISAGYYDQHLERWLSHFDRSQIWIGLYEDMVKDEVSFLKSMFEFLNVSDRSQIIDTSFKDNVSWWFSNTWPISAASIAMAPIRKLAGADPVHVLWSRSRHLRQIFFDRSKRPPKISEEAREELRAHYAPHNEKLEMIIDRPLSIWR